MVHNSVGMQRAFFAFGALAFLTGCNTAVATPVRMEPATTGALTFTPTKTKATSKALETAYFAGGCFWGLEKRFRDTPGVTGTVVGYSGGHTKNPTYKQVCYEDTGHAEAVAVQYDPAVTSYQKLAGLFFSEYHNPTTLNRQGPDHGTQYRSVIWYTNDAEKATAMQVIAERNKKLADKIVTEVKKKETFTMAEEYHQNYIEKTGNYMCPIEPPKLIDAGSALAPKR